ncbi:MAG: DNA/RNA nuclease SfsA [Candidatus Thorarchaeota archaeon]|nr:MAG: DNA/RNA nuclease SfsA [Candidatus Thorarchaeota archaeon]
MPARAHAPTHTNSVEHFTVIEAEFVARPNRFLAVVRIGGEIVWAFVPNPGRMDELLTPGATVLLRPRPNHKRKTSVDLAAVRHDGVIVSLDSNLPNRFVRQLLSEHRLPLVPPYSSFKSEPPAYGGRFDFLLHGSAGHTFIEVKSSTLVVDRTAMFPDAVTSRGARHVRYLVRALKDGTVDSAFVVFVVQRPDADAFSPNAETDPEFAGALRYAVSQGVQVIPLLTRLVLPQWTLELIRVLPLVM